MHAIAIAKKCYCRRKFCLCVAFVLHITTVSCIEIGLAPYETPHVWRLFEDNFRSYIYGFSAKKCGKQQYRAHLQSQCRLVFVTRTCLTKTTRAIPRFSCAAVYTYGIVSVCSAFCVHVYFTYRDGCAVIVTVSLMQWCQQQMGWNVNMNISSTRS